MRAFIHLRKSGPSTVNWLHPLIIVNVVIFSYENELTNQRQNRNRICQQESTIRNIRSSLNRPYGAVVHNSHYGIDRSRMADSIKSRNFQDALVYVIPQISWILRIFSRPVEIYIYKYIWRWLSETKGKPLELARNDFGMMQKTNSSLFNSKKPKFGDHFFTIHSNYTVSLRPYARARCISA